MSESKSENEYSLQYFQFSPEIFYEDFSELIMEEMSRIVKLSLLGLPELQSVPTTTNELRQYILEVHNGWCDHVKVVLNKFEPTLKSFFTIPKNVLLESDNIYKKSYSEDEVQLLEKEVADLENKYAQTLRDVTSFEVLLAKVTTLVPLIKQVDDAAEVLKPILNTINDIKELEQTANLCMESSQQLFNNGNDSDSSSEESEFQNRFNVIKN